MESETAVGPVVVDELKNQARAAGYVVVAVSKSELLLYVMYLAGIALGWSLARRA